VIFPSQIRFVNYHSPNEMTHARCAEAELPRDIISVIGHDTRARLYHDQRLYRLAAVARLIVLVAVQV
jgi:hypothetical protein